jgi:hypothetical protein
MVGQFWWFSKWGASVHANVREKFKGISHISHVKKHGDYQTHFHTFLKYYVFITKFFREGRKKSITHFWTTQK